jgi:dynein light subunit type 1
MFKIVILLLICKLCSSGTDDVTVYKNEVTKDMATHIMARTLNFLDENNDLKLVVNKIKTDLNQKYGNGWQCLAYANYNFSDPELDHEPNTLLWFSFMEKYFYIFKIMNQKSIFNTTVSLN